tara:strand:+ start:3196 stop:3801 length:606 start_codon:yes stop_codon:yes gene_type:complete
MSNKKIISSGPSDIDDVTANPGSSPIRTDLDDRSNNIKPFDEIVQSVVAIRKEVSKKHKKSYYTGVVLSVEELSPVELMGETSDEFQKSLYTTSQSIDILTPAKKMYKIVVYISEIHGFLPILNRKQLVEFNKMKQQKSENNFDEKREKEFALFDRTISRFTPFYSVDLESPPEIMSAARVEFSDENSMMFGRFLEVVSGV